MPVVVANSLFKNYNRRITIFVNFFRKMYICTLFIVATTQGKIRERFCECDHFRQQSVNPTDKDLDVNDLSYRYSLASFIWVKSKRFSSSDCCIVCRTIGQFSETNVIACFEQSLLLVYFKIKVILHYKVIFSLSLLNAF